MAASSWKDEWAEMRKAGKKLLWWVGHLSGARFLREQLHPRTSKEKDGKQPPSTIVFWLGGTYLALFGVASARHESAVDRLELRASFVVALLANDTTRVGACVQVAGLQARKVPTPPLFGDPFFFTSFWESEIYPEGVELLKRAVEASKEHLAKADLSGADLTGANLHGANLSEAEMVETKLSGADLTGANLHGANLFEAEMVETKLSGANLTGANLHGANLSEAEMVETKLSGANLTEATLRKVDLSMSSLTKADLGWANLRGANLYKVDLTKANLSRANLDKTDLRWAKLPWTKLPWADLRGANLDGANLYEAVLFKANLHGADLSGVLLHGADLYGMKGWPDVTSYKSTFIYNLKSAPKGFREYALSKGATEDPLPE